MAIPSQGTNFWTIDPDTDEVLEVGCVTNFDGLGATLGQLQTTCLSTTGSHTYRAGLGTPGAATFSVNFDPADESHVRLHQLKKLGTTLQWAIGLADGTAAPTAVVDSAGDATFDLPATRSWLTFEGFMNAYPFSIAIDAVVSSTIGIQVSGDEELTVKSA